jgi:tRNA-splicing ligase RtcB
MELVEEGPYRFRIPQRGKMRVPGIVYASGELVLGLAGDRCLEQVANVATLPGIVTAAYAMPDLHLGYGFPIGGVAATDPAAGGVVSPGGVGFDISCGVRLLAASLGRDEVMPVLGILMDRLAAAVPRGAGRGGIWHLSGSGQLADVLAGGARYALKQGYGTERDLARCEDGDAVDGADPGQVSTRAVDRGLRQVGSLGSGNHFLEVQAVEEVYDTATAQRFGLAAGQVCVMIHCGSRGLGHQICGDHVRIMEAAMPRYGITVPDRQLACAPVSSPEGRGYLGAMAAAANYGRVNRHVLAHTARGIFARTAGARLDLVYDVSHNLAKMETHEVAGKPALLCVHRKGATRALPPGHPDLPADLREAGQPVLIPGSMGTFSYVLAGIAGGGAFHSTCHGAGRVMSRHRALRTVSGPALRRRLEAAGIAVRGASARGLAEETPEAYKDVNVVVDAAEGGGLCRKIARLVPLGVVKG